MGSSPPVPDDGFVAMAAKCPGVSETTITESVTRNRAFGKIPKDRDVANVCILFCSDQAPSRCSASHSVTDFEQERGR